MTSDASGWEATYWRSLVEASPDLVLVVDVTGTILFVNRVVPFLAERGVVGRKMWEFAVGDAASRITEKLREVVESRKAVVYDNPGLRSDGSAGWYEVRAIPVLVDGVVARVLWASSDISERKQLEERLRQSQKMEAVGLLAGGVAHDFNNLLAVVMGLGEVAARALPPDHPVGVHLRGIADAAKRGRNLTRQLLAFSRNQIIRPRLLDLGVTVSGFADMIRRIVGEDVAVIVEAPETSLTVRADPVQLEQVLLNLCMNARQAMPAGGEIHISTQAVDFDDEFAARNPWARAGSFAKVSVRDTGVGMDAGTAARAFEPFFTTKREGTGLGLSTVYGIVQQHGGFLDTASTPGAGTTVAVYLERVPDAAVSPTIPPKPASPDSLRGEEVVLLAEDEPALRTLFEGVLTQFGYRVIVASDGEEAVRAFGDHAPEIALAVLDVVLPRLDARGVYEQICRVRPDVKVLFMTGYAPASTRLAELLEERDLPLLLKPFTPLELAAAVRRAIDGSALQRRRVTPWRHAGLQRA